MKYLLNMIICFTSFMMLNSCGNENMQVENNEEKDSSQVVAKRSEKEQEEVNVKYEENSKEIPNLKFKIRKIIGSHKEVNRKSTFYTDYIDKCAEWTLKENEIVDILESSKIIDGEEFSYYFDILPCYYSGEVIINNDITATFEINSGSSTTLILLDTFYFLGYFGNREYFILPPGLACVNYQTDKAYR